jgi:NTE family protein
VRAVLLGLVLLLTAPVAAARGGDAAPALDAPPPRPRIALVLSGGGARGLAHVGVLKVLEEARVPVDVVVGTSMGAIIGGLYAAGMSPGELERELVALDWDAVFAARVPRETLSQRRKEEDFEISPAIEIGWRDGSPTLPLGSVSTRGLELLLRRYTLPVRGLRDFDALPTPFRAVATDLETGAAVVFRDGDLAQALRASMSVPGVFPPTEVNGRLLGDGGLVDNLPVSVARALGAEVVIAVNIGTPLARRESLGSLVGVTAQMINILTEQNVQRSTAELEAGRDLLLSPPLGDISSGDFARVRELMDIGERHARAMAGRFAPLALSPEDWSRRRLARTPPYAPAAPIAQVRFEGTAVTNPQRFATTLRSQAGRPVDLPAAEADVRALAATGDYLHVDYRLEDLPGGTGLVFDLEEKPWGPHYVRLGLDIGSDFAGRGDFNVKLSHNRHWATANGAEWRNRLQIGSVPRWFSEWYQPLNWTLGVADDWFLAPWADVERRRVTVYQSVTPTQTASRAIEVGRLGRSRLRTGLDLGQPWGAIGELRLGVVREGLRIDPDFMASDGSGVPDAQTATEWVAQASLVMDQLDFASFPSRGWRVRAALAQGRRWADAALLPGGSDRVRRLEFDGLAVTTRGRNTLEGLLRVRWADQTLIQGQGQYWLGGFQNLSGYKPDQLNGNQVLLGRLSWYRRLNSQPVLTRGFFAGMSLEAGNAWARRTAVRGDELRWGGSLFIGADTGLGPLYLGLTGAPKGSAGLYLLLGRP